MSSNFSGTWERVVTYVDGFNLYFGIREACLRQFLWLDVGKLAASLLKPGQRLMSTKYFTSRVSGTPQDPGKVKRQAIYLDALSAQPGIDIFYGQYLGKTSTCRNCGSSWRTYEEKMTDVNIAVQVMADFFLDKCDIGTIVSGDSDLAGLIQTLTPLFPHKRVVVAFPPKRVSMRLKSVAHAWLNVARKRLADNQLPEKVTTSSGQVLERPPSWC